MTGEQPLTFGYSYNSNGTLATKTYPQSVTINYVYDRGHCIATKRDSINICLTTLDSGNMTVRYVGGKLMYGNPRLAPIDHGGIIFNSGGSALPMGGDPYTPQDFGDPIPDFPIDTLPEMPIIIDSDHYFAWNSALQHRAEYDTRGYLTKLATQKDSLMFSFQSGTGNLLSRTGMTSQTETFAYDAVDRLTQVSGSTTHSVSYLDNGNIYQKTGPGIYSYLSSHPHAVANVTNPQSIISSATQTATYTPFGKVSTLSDNGYTLTFTYGPDEQRWKTVLQSSGNTVRTTLYADSYERITENGQSRHFYYLDGGVIYVLNDGASVGSFYYTFTDHLGSITRIYNKNGTKVFSAEYDAWGNQTITLDILDFHRGYTGHEMLPEFNLINMNGRLYDPVLGRFLSPDNYVQMPDFSQSFNRYSYCLNNPLKYVDPDGEFWHLVIGALIGGIMNCSMNAENVNNFWDGLGYFGVGAFAGALSAGIGSGVNVAMAGGAFSAGFSGTATGIASTGFLSGALTGAASGFSSAFVTEAGNSWICGDSFGKGLLNGLQGGGTAALTAGIVGGTIGGIDALGKGTNFWTGKSTFDMSKAHAAYGFTPGEGTITGKYVGKFEGINVFENDLIMGDISKGSNLRGATFPGRGIIVSKGVLTGGGNQGKALLQHEFGHILQYRAVGPKAYYSIIAPESLASACRSEIKHDHFWTETWANYLSKEYFGVNWLGAKYGYVVQPLYSFNKSIIELAKMPIVWSPIIPFSH